MSNEDKSLTHKGREVEEKQVNLSTDKGTLTRERKKTNVRLETELEQQCPPRLNSQTQTDVAVKDYGEESLINFPNYVWNRSYRGLPIRQEELPSHKKSLEVVAKDRKDQEGNLRSYQESGRSEESKLASASFSNNLGKLVLNDEQLNVLEPGPKDCDWNLAYARGYDEKLEVENVNLKGEIENSKTITRKLKTDLAAFKATNGTAERMQSWNGHEHVAITLQACIPPSLERVFTDPS